MASTISLSFKDKDGDLYEVEDSVSGKLLAIRRYSIVDGNDSVLLEMKDAGKLIDLIKLVARGNGVEV
jgi:hypothetical protein